MSEKVIPKMDKPLMPLYKFTATARVTEGDVQTSNEQWKAERHGDEFQNILEAKTE